MRPGGLRGLAGHAYVVDRGQEAGGAEVTLLEAINAVRNDVPMVAKADQFDGGRQRYNFRGVDRVVTALNASMRKHGLIMVPVAVDGPDWISGVTTSGGTPTNVARVKVTYRLAVAGATEHDWLDVQAAGEAFDTGDKAVSKAMSVAWRTALIQTFFLATGDPDPDEDSYQVDKPRQQRPQTRIDRKLADFDLDAEIKGKTYDQLGELYLSLKQQGAPVEQRQKVWEAAHGPTVPMPQ
jgi:hypothetical protein